jgi:hypothetical protein
MMNNSHNNNDNHPFLETTDDASRSSNDSTSTVSQHATDVEGYTPLNFNMNDMIPMNDDDDDDNENEINGDEFASNGYYHMLGVPPKRVNGVKHHALGFSMGHDYENSEDDDASFENQNATDTTSSEAHIPDDFLSLAEQALRGLEDEHRATLQLSSAHISTIDDTVTNSIPNHDDIVTASFQPSSSTTEADEWTEPITSNFGKIFPPFEEVTTESVSNTPEPKPMDVNAIQKAMQSIRLKSPQLANTLDAGASASFSPSSTALQTSLRSVINFTSQSVQSMERQSINNHAIIPVGPLAAFRRSTPKAKSASANLSRSATLSEAVLRLWPLISFRRRMRVMGIGEQKSHYDSKYSKTLTIHILGCDNIECSSEETLRKSVGPFARWICAALQSGVLSTSQTPESTRSEIDSLVIEMSGPNVPSWILSQKINLLSSSSSESGGLFSATAIFHQREYHEQNICGAGVVSTPDLAVAFNAGIWGYDSWKPTLSYMCHSEGNDSYSCTPFVITAYTLEECEDDAEVVSEVAEEAVAKRMQSSKHRNEILAHQLWAPEANPFSSRIERETASVPRKYYENNAWQAWLLGPSTSAK